jgi:predicted site-specific integrase-resolvase
MKLSDYARRCGVSYRTAWRWWKSGSLSGYQQPTGTIIIDEPLRKSERRIIRAAIYCRVSSSENKANLESQAERLKNYCSARGYKLVKDVKEIGSGVNNKRKKLLNLLHDKSVDVIVVEHKDRLTRFGFNYINELLELQKRSIEVINTTEDEKEDLIQDFVSIITSFCSRLYGQRRCKRKTEKIISELKNEK